MSTDSGNKITFTIKRKTNPGLLIFMGLWLLGWVFITSTFLVGVVGDAGKRDAEIYFYLFIIVILGLWVLKRFLWLLRGKEYISLDENYFIIEHHGTFLTSQRKYETPLIENFSLAINQTTPMWYRFYGFGGGQIIFEYLDQKKYFGQTLTAEEAQEIISRLKAHLNKVRTD